MDNDWNPKHFDEWGNEYVLTESGERVPPMQVQRDSKGDYDTSQGHCGLCGSLICRGTCFK